MTRDPFIPRREALRDPRCTRSSSRDSQLPDLAWLEETLETSYPPPRVVVLTNPCNPTGTVLDRHDLQRASYICAKAGAWLVMDNTYEVRESTSPFVSGWAPRHA